MRYRFDITCPRCGGDVIHAAASAPSPVLTLTARAVAHCPRCTADWVLVLELAPVRRDVEGELKPCGTETAYKRHLQRGEAACQACRDAHRIHAAGQPKRSHHKKKAPA